MTVDSFFYAALLAASLDIEVRPPVDAEKEAEIIAWVESTADAMSLAYGRFPNPEARIIVITSTENSWGGDSPVRYGRVTRHRGETVELFVNPDRPMEEFYSDWTATHEFSHLMLPLLDKRYRWISEGFATYYQNVLMSRSGRYTEEFAWQRLSEGFARGVQSRPDLSPNEAAAAGIRHARMKVYWSGAAIALLADIELRQRSDGKSRWTQFSTSCNDAVCRQAGAGLARNCFGNWTALPQPRFSCPCTASTRIREGFPDTSEILLQLGVGNDPDGTVSLDDQSALAAIRATLTALR